MQTIETPERRRPPQFQDHFDRTTRSLRTALADLVASVAADPARPQEMARRFRLNKNLTWKVSKIITSDDAVATAPHIPGAAGVRILLDAFAAHGAPAERVSAVRRALSDFEEMVRLHAGDRTKLELMLSSSEPSRVQSERIETSRRLAFHGNSACLGVQAAVRFSLQVLVPSSTGAAGRVDIATLGGVVGFRRLRPTGSWPLVKFSGYGGDTRQLSPMDQEIAANQAPLLHEFCAGELPAIRAVPQSEGVLFELGEGPVGDAAALNCVFGWVSHDFASMYAEDPGEKEPIGEHFIKLDAPSEVLQFDLFVHRDLPFPQAPSAHLYSLMQGDIRYPLTRQQRNLLPVPETVEELGSGASALETPHVPDYERMVERASGRLGSSIQDLRGFRFTMKYPPIPSFAVFRHPLARRS